jgi:hypothetical protein
MAMSTTTATTTSGHTFISNSSSRETLHVKGNIKYASFIFSGKRHFSYTIVSLIIQKLL